ncbi:MAG TPA: dihydroneopterin aldolase [Draconibacterium sp.]|nr:dihydroneopterin aldolase [Draconibacterium sp.]
MGRIEIEGMHFYAYHGHFEAEQIVGNPFNVDLVLETNCDNAAKSDNLKDALNYQAVYEIVQKEMMQKSRLLENVAKRILDALYLSFPSIENATVKVSKLNPPMGGQIEKVSVTLSR